MSATQTNMGRIVYMSNLSSVFKLAAIASFGPRPLIESDYFSGPASNSQMGSAATAELHGLRGLIQQSIANSFSLLA